MQAYPPGSVIVLPGDTWHFHWAKSGEYVTQVTAIGPLGLEYLDPGADPDPYPAWHSSQTINNGRNIAGYTSNDADKLVEEARRSFDIANRKSLYSQFQALFLLDAPSIPLYVPLDTYFVRGKVSGVDPGVLFSPASRFRNVYQWTITNPPALGNN